jgi:hypothetical protein
MNNRLVLELEHSKERYSQLIKAQTLLERLAEAGEEHVVVSYSELHAKKAEVVYTSLGDRLFAAVYDSELFEDFRSKLFCIELEYSLLDEDDPGEYETFYVLRAVSGKLLDGEIVNENEPILSEKVEVDE